MTSDYYSGDFGTGNGSDVGIADDFFTKNVEAGSKDTPRWEETTSSEGNNLVSYINAQYTAGAKAGDYIFLRLSVDNVSMNGSQYFGIDDATASNPPTLLIKYDSPTPVSDVISENVSLNVYPNPVTDGHFVVSTSGLSENATLTIFSMTGELVYNKPIGSSYGKTDVSVNLPRGLYLVRITDGNVIKTAKLKIQ